MLTISPRGAAPATVSLWAVEGDVDLSSAHLIRDGLTPPYEEGCRLLVLDLAGVTFFDSTGLRAVNEVQQAAAGHDVGIALVGVTPPVAKLLAISGLNTSLPSFDSAEQAAAALLGPR